MKDKFTIPKLSKGVIWFVFFRYNGKLHRFKEQLNRIKDLNERERLFLILRDVLHDKLKAGWNPEIPEIIKKQIDLNLIDALRFALEKKKPNISPKTYSGYNGSVNFLETAIKNIGLSNINIIDVKRVHVKLIMEKAKELNSWSNKAHNKHLNHFKAILSELIEFDIIEDNPAFKVKNLRVEESIAHVPASDKQMEVIKKELIENHPNFYNYIRLIFDLGIRPVEILAIQLNMIDMENNIIQLIPKNTKGRKKYRTLPINKYLKEYLLSMKFDKLPQDYYLFGSFKEPSIGNRGKNQFLPDFIPAPTHINRDTATRRWETIVKKGLGFKEITMYSMKKFGSNKKYEAGISLDAIQGVFGHSKKETTLIYVTKQNEINRKEIMDKSPDL